VTGHLRTGFERAKGVGMTGIARQCRLVANVSKIGIAPALEFDFSRCANENDLKMDHQMVGRRGDGFALARELQSLNSDRGDADGDFVLDQSRRGGIRPFRRWARYQF